MASLNQCEFIGNIGRDPELKFSGDGTAICNFSIAINETWKDRNTGEKKESTEWVRVVAYRQVGEFVGNFLKQGRQVWVQGKMKTRKFQDKETGADKYITEIVADKVQGLGGREDSQQASQAPQRQQAPARQSAPAQQANRGNSLDDLDDSIPF